MFRVQMSAQRHSFESCGEYSSCVRFSVPAGFVSCRSLARRGRGWDTDFPFRGVFRLASAVWPRLFPEFCFHVGGEFDAFRHSRFLFHIAPAGHATT